MTGDITLLGYGLATLGPALAVGMIFAAYLNGWPGMRAMRTSCASWPMGRRGSARG